MIRDAIGILRSAARRAERDDAGRIRDADIEAAIPAARRELRQKSLDRLMIVSQYATRVDGPRSKRTVRKYLRKLEQHNLIESAGEGPSRVYRLADG